MSNVIEQVREGLEAKIDGIKVALNFVKDPREIERLQLDLSGAVKALKKLDEKDTRTPEELENISKMIKDGVVVEAPINPWSKLTPLEKFKYQLNLYFSKILETYETASTQYEELNKTCDFLSKVDFKEHPSIKLLYKQLKKSLFEIEFSVASLSDQISKKEVVFELVDGVFDSLVIINQFLNNPMSLPHLSEERDAKLKEIQNEKN